MEKITIATLDKVSKITMEMLLIPNLVQALKKEYGELTYPVDFFGYLSTDVYNKENPDKFIIEVMKSAQLEISHAGTSNFLDVRFNMGEMLDSLKKTYSKPYRLLLDIQQGRDLFKNDLENAGKLEVYEEIEEGPFFDYGYCCYNYFIYLMYYYKNNGKAQSDYIRKSYEVIETLFPKELKEFILSGSIVKYHGTVFTNKLSELDMDIFGNYLFVDKDKLSAYLGIK